MISIARLSTLLSSTLVVLVACSGDDATSPSVNAEGACDQGASSFCTRVNECAPFYITFAYGTVSACIERIKINCTAQFSAPGTSATPSRLAACASEVKTASCEDIFGRTAPPSCEALPGSLADGSGCAFADQCKGKRCNLANNSTCGACSTLVAVGGTCNRDEDCDRGLNCAQNKCVAYGKAGNACSDAAPCLATLSCVNGTCATSLGAGASCTPSSFDTNACNVTQGYYCDTQTKLCAKIGAAAAGEACGLFATGGATICSGAGRCVAATGKTSGTCQAAAADGASCDDTKGPSCLAPARCISGVCKITDPVACR